VATPVLDLRFPQVERSLLCGAVSSRPHRSIHPRRVPLGRDKRAVHFRKSRTRPHEGAQRHPRWRPERAHQRNPGNVPTGQRSQAARTAPETRSTWQSFSKTGWSSSRSS